MGKVLRETYFHENAMKAPGELAATHKMMKQKMFDVFEIIFSSGQRRE